MLYVKIQAVSISPNGNSHNVMDADAAGSLDTSDTSVTEQRSPMAIIDPFNGGERPVVIMDGGLGTALEHACRIKIAGTPLWSAEALSKEPEAIVAAHLAFLRAGAEVIETSTYQCSLSTFERSGYGNDIARQLMHRAVLLAQQARDKFDEERRTGDATVEEVLKGPAISPVRICLSLGPFGATLSPTQEFGGFYPPPYGPRGFSCDSHNLNFFDDEEEENKAIEALTVFHFERLSLFAQDREIWSCIDIIAFETMPLAREVVAIRRAMRQLFDRNQDMTKAWWISFIFPDGLCPQMLDSNGNRLTTLDMVRAALSSSPSGFQHGNGALPVPSGLGVNCTSIEFIPRIVREMEVACRAVSDQRLWLVVYPNGGDVYDEVLQTWRSSNLRAKDEWTSGLVTVVKNILNSPDVNWAGVIVGGCCRCEAEQIQRLANVLK